MMHVLRENPEPDPLQPSPEALGELANLVLTNNVFEFNGKFYLQTQGTAMGTKMPPSYANIFMGKIEQQLRQIGGENIFLWKRFIDDIFMVWLGTEEELKSYLSTINTIRATIKFTCEYSKNSTTFLDVTVYKGERFL